MVMVFCVPSVEEGVDEGDGEDCCGGEGEEGCWDGWFAHPDTTPIIPRSIRNPNSSRLHRIFSINVRALCLCLAAERESSGKLVWSPESLEELNVWATPRPRSVSPASFRVP